MKYVYLCKHGAIFVMMPHKLPPPSSSSPCPHQHYYQQPPSSNKHYWRTVLRTGQAFKQVKTSEEYELSNGRSGFISSTSSSPLPCYSDSPSPVPHWKAIQHPFFTIRHSLNKIYTLYSMRPQTKPNVQTALTGPWLPFCYSQHWPGSEAS